MSELPSFSLVINAQESTTLETGKTFWKPFKSPKPSTPWTIKCQFRQFLKDQHAQENLDFHDAVVVYKKQLRQVLDMIPILDDKIQGKERKSRQRQSLLLLARGLTAKVIDFDHLLSQVPMDSNLKSSIESQIIGLKRLLQEIQRRFLMDSLEEVNLPGLVTVNLLTIVKSGIPEGKAFDEALVCIESSLRGNWIEFVKTL